jgi:hypothetical protein
MSATGLGEHRIDVLPRSLLVPFIVIHAVGSFHVFWVLGASRLIKFCDVSFSYGVIEHARTHEESKGAFFTFQKENTMTNRDRDQFCRYADLIGR